MRFLAVAFMLFVSATVAAAQGMPDIRQMAGIPLPSTDLPSGTVSVRAVRGSLANNLANVDVVLNVDGRDATVKTDASGRGQLTGIPRGSRVVARLEVDGERAESQPFTMAQNGIRVVLAIGISGSAPAPTTPGAPAARGTITLEPDSRVVIDFAGERLNVYYVLQLHNASSAPVDIGGPLVVDLPEDALGATILEGSTPQATANGTKLTVVGPFAPGTTSVHLGFEYRTSGGTAHLEQRFPIDLPGFALFALRTADLDVASPQLSSKQSMTQQGQPIVGGRGNAVSAGQPLVIDITGLPHHPAWPRYVALSLAGVLISAGIAAAFAPSRRRSA